MRIRLKGILVDVATGNWKMLTPEAQSDARFNSGKTRVEEDQKLVLGAEGKRLQSLVADLLSE